PFSLVWPPLLWRSAAELSEDRLVSRSGSRHRERSHRVHLPRDDTTERVLHQQSADPRGHPEPHGRRRRQPMPGGRQQSASAHRVQLRQSQENEAPLAVLSGRPHPEPQVQALPGAAGEQRLGVRLPAGAAEVLRPALEHHQRPEEPGVLTPPGATCAHPFATV
ncbi:unnamed protein product, partial [Gulo gulo]